VGVSLFCLPYAGAGAGIYRRWPMRLPHDIETVALNLPGRGARYGEPAVCDWGRLVDILLADMTPRLDRPFAFFGHSMGALVALELAHEVRRRHGRTPVWFCASGCRAPAHRRPDTHWLDCPEDILIEKLRTLNGTPAEFLENREMLDLMLPALRADFHLCGTYRPVRRLPLDCPLLVLCGRDDHDVASPREQLTDWAAEASGPFRIEMMPGGHFFLDADGPATIEQAVEGLGEAAALSALA
jgi:surfactin synthase thioesterase subunit